ncbi:MAG: hypothetical protein E7604_06900 [Ruminococcaceae bacterium]|nr:hypothetical protein [Oscillospiraceae bacterium]
MMFSEHNYFINGQICLRDTRLSEDRYAHPIHIRYSSDGVMTTVEEDVYLTANTVNGLDGDKVRFDTTLFLPTSDGGYVSMVHDDKNETVRVVKTDTDYRITSESESIPTADMTPPDARFQARLLYISDDAILFYNRYEPTSFWIFDGALIRHGVFQTASQLSDGYRASDGSVILCCQDGSALRYDPLTDTVLPVTLHTDTENYRRAEQIFYTDGAVYLFCREAVYVQRDGVETLLIDFAQSYVSWKDISVADVMDGDRFLIWYYDAMTELSSPAIFAPDTVGVPVDRRTFRVASAYCSNEERDFLTLAVNHFNRENEKWFAEYTDLDAAFSHSDSAAAQIGGGEYAAVTDLLRADLEAGMEYDLYLIGYAYGTQDYLNMLDGKDCLYDMAAWLADFALTDSLCMLAQQDSGAVYALPVSAQYHTFLTTDALCPTEQGLTWNAFADLVRSVTPDGGAPLFDRDASLTLMTSRTLDFIGGEACDFLSDAFPDTVDVISALKENADNRYYDHGYRGKLSTGGGTLIAEGNPIGDLAAGKIRMLHLRLDSGGGTQALLAALSAENAAWQFCGYPTGDGGKPVVNARLTARAAVHTEADDGIKALLSLLYSDEIQTSSVYLRGALPVTKSAFSTLLMPGIFHIDKITVPQSNGKVNTQIMAYHILTDGNEKDRSSIAVSEVLCSRLLYHLTALPTIGNTDTVIDGIVNEELDAVYHGIRTKEEAAEIIQSRVSIYLSE